MSKMHETQIDVRWGDMDAYGHVNNTLFFRYLEMARFDYFAVVCASVSTDIPMIVLADIRCQFMAELRYPAKLRVTSQIVRFGQSSFDLEAEIYCGDKCHAKSLATLVWLNPETRRPAPVPEEVRLAVARYHS